jgi:hypothetical protein
MAAAEDADAHVDPHEVPQKHFPGPHRRDGERYVIDRQEEEHLETGTGNHGGWRGRGGEGIQGERVWRSYSGWEGYSYCFTPGSH